MLGDVYGDPSTQQPDVAAEPAGRLVEPDEGVHEDTEKDAVRPPSAATAATCQPRRLRCTWRTSVDPTPGQLRLTTRPSTWTVSPLLLTLRVTVALCRANGASMISCLR